MNVKNIGIALVFVAGITLGMTSCKSQAQKDAEAQAKIEAQLTPGITVEVKDGIATIDGQFTDEVARANTEAEVKSIAGVKSVVNNGTVEPPIVINPDETLISGVNALMQGYTGVSASVNEGVVTLTGEINREDWMNLKPALDALRPKQVVNNLTVK